MKNMSSIHFDGTSVISANKSIKGVSRKLLEYMNAEVEKHFKEGYRTI